MRAWLKGGIIGALLYFFVQFIDDFFYVFYSMTPLQPIKYYLYFDFLGLYDTFALECYGFIEICGIAYIVLLGFIIGAIIGWIAGLFFKKEEKVEEKKKAEVKPLSREKLIKQIDEHRKKINDYKAALAREAEIKRKKEQDPEKIKKEITSLLDELKRMKIKKEIEEKRAEQQRKREQKERAKEEKRRKREEEERRKREEKAKKEQKKREERERSKREEKAKKEQKKREELAKKEKKKASRKKTRKSKPAKKRTRKKKK